MQIVPMVSHVEGGQIIPCSWIATGSKVPTIRCSVRYLDHVYPENFIPSVQNVAHVGHLVNEKTGLFVVSCGSSESAEHASVAQWVVTTIDSLGSNCLCNQAFALRRREQLQMVLICLLSHRSNACTHRHSRIDFFSRLTRLSCAVVRSMLSTHACSVVPD